MNRRVGLLTFILAVALAVPATAQVRKRDHRKKKDRNEEVVKARRGKKGKGSDPIKVTSWAPRSGSVGTRVRIDGKGFTRKTLLLVGGKRVKPRRLGRTYIELEIPRRWGDGVIVLRHPNMADDLVVGTFEVIADPRILSVSPSSGVGGTRIEIRGTGFRKGDRVLMNNRAIAVKTLSARRIVATVPDNASTDYITVSRPKGASARSPKKFDVVRPAPAISGVEPDSAGAGDTVRITGRHFTDKDRVFYGRWPMKVTASAATWIDAVIPRRARTDEYITVRNGWGQDRTRGRFQLARPPQISRFSPSYGVVGQRVEIYGANFMAGDDVTLAGRPVKILQLRSRQISVEIPLGARSGNFTVHRGNTRVSARGDFDVVYAPSVSGFSPSGGEAGTRVTITGRYFTPDARVYYGRQKLRVFERSDSALVVQIPSRARDHRFTVRTQGGEASTDRPFRVYEYSTVTGVHPTEGPAGTVVEITGRDFTRTDRFYVGRDELAVVEWSARRVRAKIPKGAESGRIGWESYGRFQKTRYRFDVLVPPSIARFTPHAGPGGTEIAIFGDNFTRDTRVLFGNDEIRVVKRVVPNQLVAQIPVKARGTKYIWVVDAGARVRSTKAFAVVSPPNVGSFTPAYGAPGTEVTLVGEHFSKATRVRYGRVDLPVVSWNATTLTVKIPDNAKPGKDYFWVEEGRMAERAPRPFEVTGWAEITGFSPRRAKPGQRVVIKGKNFSRDTKVMYGKYECDVVKVHPRGKQIHVILADDANGRGYMWAVQGGHRTKSPDQLEVIGRENERRRPPKRGYKKKRRKRGR